MTEIVVTHKSYYNPSPNMDALLTFPDGRTILVHPLQISTRLRVFDGAEPTIAWLLPEKEEN